MFVSKGTPFFATKLGGGVVGIALPIKYRFLPGPDIFMSNIAAPGCFLNFVPNICL